MNKIDVLARINPQMKAVVAKSAELAKDAYDTSAGFDAMRAGYIKERAFWNEGGPKVAKTVDSQIKTPHGLVNIRFYYPDVALETSSAPAIIYIHGGGFVLGNLDTHDKIMRLHADQTQAVVVGIDYALSPEAKFPVALEQCAAVIQHIHNHGSENQIDGNDLSLAGDSGGAMICLGSYLYLRDQMAEFTALKPAYIRCLLLYYGMYGLHDSVSKRQLGGPWDGLTREDMEYYFDCYLADASALTSPYLDCFRSDLSKNVPPCFIAAAEFDPLQDDSKLLDAILTEAKINHKFKLYKGVLHAFLHNSRMLDEAHLAIKEGSDFFKDLAIKR